MAEEKIEPREINYRQWLPWTQSFRGFWFAIDPNKLLLALLNNKEGARSEAAALTIDTDYEATRIQALLPKGAPRVELGSSKLAYLDLDKRHGDLRTWPWFEDRGPNPYLLLVPRQSRATAWERGHFVDWLLRQQVPVLIEPLVKFVRPITYLLNPYAGFTEGL